ncbi:MAG: thioredoxin [Rhodospirillaceae bacterium]|jgi:putative thioredoxin|nr:thioredoxin [Rhodospirillaceae bacterium]
MEPILNTDTTSQTGSGDLIKDTSEATFVQDVIEASQETPVIVDFWAPWCGPCKQLGPLLEKVVTEANGSVKMVKVDIDQNQNLAQQLRIQSIPAVYAFFQGKPVDAFQGVLPESQLKEFVDKLAQSSGTKVKSPIDEALEQANQLLEEKLFEQASSIFSQIIQHASDNLEAKVGLAKCAIETDKHQEARDIIDGLSEDEKTDPALLPIVNALELADKVADVGDLDTLKSEVQQNSKDYNARYDLALALYASGQAEAATEELLEIIRQNRNWNDDAARLELLKIFEVLGPTDPITIAGRRKLSSILFS